MPTLTDLAGLLGWALALAAIATALTGRFTGRRLPRALAAVAAALFAWVPLDGLPLAAYPRGVFGDLSLLAQWLLAGWLLDTLTSGAHAPAVDERIATRLLVVAAALLLYPAVLGTGSWDPYRWGYGDVAFLGALLAVALVAVRQRWLRVAAGVALAVLGWAAGWLESTNLWDYVVDPLLGLWAAFALAGPVLRRLFPRKPAPTDRRAFFRTAARSGRAER